MSRKSRTRYEKRYVITILVWFRKLEQICDFLSERDSHGCEYVRVHYRLLKCGYHYTRRHIPVIWGLKYRLMHNDLILRKGDAIIYIMQNKIILRPFGL